MKSKITEEAIYLLQEGEQNPPPFYQVVMHNDDFTPMEFVMSILEKLFYMSRQKAAQIMLEAHTKGQAVCGQFTKEIAESKVVQVLESARHNGHPLICSMEAEV